MAALLKWWCRKRPSDEVVDLVSGQVVPSQIETRGPVWLQHYLSFLTEDVPSFGYRTYAVRQATVDNRLAVAASTQAVFENEYYRLAVNPKTGGLDALLAKEAGRELVSAKDGFALNEYRYY